MIVVRHERPNDVEAVRTLNRLAFGQETEGRIVDLLRERCGDTVSLVAVEEEEIVGHIFFSPVTIAGDAGPILGMGLGPMAVHPARQRAGIGSLLVRQGLDHLRHRDCPFVVVLGHPSYYPRFGFERASLHGLASQWEAVPDEAFMVLPFNRTVMHAVSGVARYREEFDLPV
jgi:putative acetyltransferase